MLIIHFFATFHYLHKLRFPTLIRSIPIVVQNSSLILHITEIKIPNPPVKPNCMHEITKPPSRPPSCKGIKNNRLAMNEVSAIISVAYMNNCAKLPSTPDATKTK